MNDKLKFFGATALGMAAGLLVGYKYAEKKLGLEFEQRLEDETAAMKDFYSMPSQTFKTPQEAAAVLIVEEEIDVPEKDPREKKQRTEYHKIVKKITELTDEEVEEQLASVKKDDEHIANNIFAGEPDLSAPHVISQDEFNANDPEHEQATLTFYMKGGVLTDHKEDPFEDSTKFLGSDWAGNFGFKSTDKNVVHVRNSSIHMDFEIVQSDRSYEEDVLGLSDNEEPAARLRREG